MTAAAEAPDPVRVVRAYHERTKHHPFRFAAGPGGLDWANQPDPFRRWEGAELVRLPVDPPDRPTGPSYDDALVEGRVAPEPLALATVARLLRDALSLTAWKAWGGTRWALRANPSSGNLHPTEATLVCGPLPGLADAPAVWHYAPREHGLERRATLPDALWRAVRGDLPEDALLVGLSTLPWREAWKYGERAWRYCCHDAGHALGALAVAAAGLGWRARLADGPSTAALGALLGLRDDGGPEVEHAEALVVVRADGQAGGAPRLDADVVRGLRALAWQGRPSRLSSEHVLWDAVDAAAAACAKPEGAGAPYAAWAAPGEARPRGVPTVPLRPLVHRRRSAVAMDGRTATTREALAAMLEAVVPRAGRVPSALLPWSPRVHLALLVHRVEGLEPGLYWLARDPARREAAREALRPGLAWERPDGVPPDLPLDRLGTADLRGAAARVACGQAIAGDGAFAVLLVGELERSLAEHGAWLYARLHWEAGLVGQSLYLEAEAAGLRATGIGCFFDDATHELLGLAPRSGLACLYQFTVGGAVEDARLTTLPPYPAP